MKFNWRVIVAFVVLAGVIFWGANSILTRSYNGTDLNFGVGSGPVTVTNPSDQSLPVQLVSSRPGTFRVLSTIEGMSGSSTRQGSGRNATQFFEFDLPSGVSGFSVARGAEITFVANADTPLEATVQPLNAENSQTTLIATVVVILGALFYISRTTGHNWISRFRRVNASVQDTQPTAVPAAIGDSNVGRDGRLYTDA